MTVLFHNWLKQQRLAQQLSIANLAKRLNKPHLFVQQIEDGTRQLDIVEYINYCKTLNIDPKEGLTWIHNQIIDSINKQELLK